MVRGEGLAAFLRFSRIRGVTCFNSHQHGRGVSGVAALLILRRSAAAAGQRFYGREVGEWLRPFFVRGSRAALWSS